MVELTSNRICIRYEYLKSFNWLQKKIHINRIIHMRQGYYFEQFNCVQTNEGWIIYKNSLQTMQL